MSTGVPLRAVAGGALPKVDGVVSARRSGGRIGF